VTFFDQLSVDVDVFIDDKVGDVTPEFFGCSFRATIKISVKALK
jgi:hypothetical protein